MTARKKKRVRSKSKIWRVVSILILTFCLIFFLFRKGVWERGEKLSIATRSLDGSVSVLIFDSIDHEITKLSLPPMVQLEASRGLGTWNASSIWKLGYDEGYRGKLLSETLTKNLKIPIVGWADTLVMGFWDNSPVSLVRAVLYSYKSNLSFLDRIKLAAFSISTKEFKRSEIDLEKVGFLVPKILPGGDKGCVLSEKIPERLLGVASVNSWVGENIKVMIIDATEEKEVPQGLGELIEAMGAKLALVKKEPPKEDDCTVYASQEKLVDTFSQTFSCRYGGMYKDSNFGVVVEIGKKFEERF